MAFSGAFILGAGFSKFLSKLMEAELGKAASLETSFLSFISSHIHQESHKCDSTLKKSWRTDSLWQLYLWILPDQHKEFCLCRTILEIHIKQQRHLLLHFTALILLEVYSYTGQQQTGDGVEMLISSFFAVSSASQTNHHLLVCGCGVCKATRKPALVLTQHFVCMAQHILPGFSCSRSSCSQSRRDVHSARVRFRSCWQPGSNRGEKENMSSHFCGPSLHLMAAVYLCLL